MDKGGGMAYLIDGFNLIYKFPDLEELMIASRLDEARIGLLQKLKRYAAISKKAMGVVFDGKSSPRSRSPASATGASTCTTRSTTRQIT
jgi:predicted RNA-binding protein with PIN domain